VAGRARLTPETREAPLPCAQDSGAFGGLTDHAFRLIPMLEAGRDARWDDLFATAEAVVPS
jgi:hypothetical protein